MYIVMNEDVSSPPRKRMKRCEVKQLNEAMTEYELYVVRSKSKPITFWVVNDWDDKEPQRVMTISPRKK